MNLDPLGYYKWHWLRFRASRKVQKMSLLARGIYRELLDEQWAKGCVNDDPDALKELLEDSDEVLAIAKQVLSKCFTEIQPGFWQNETLEEQRTEKDSIRSKRKIAGSLGGKAKTSVEANAKQMEANASKCHIEREREEREERERGEVKPVPLKAEITPAEPEPPEGLHELNYGRRFWDDLGIFPDAKMLEIAGGNIKLIARDENCSMVEAMKRCVSRAVEYRRNTGKAINRWFFTDGHHRAGQSGMSELERFKKSLEK